MKSFSRRNLKAKGINAERELLHMFWATGKWIAMRAPGSGAIRYPVPDLLVGNHSRKFAIECKTTKNGKQYLRKEQMANLKKFSEVFGAEPWVGIKFGPERKLWYFLTLEDLDLTEGENYIVSLDSARRKGLVFDELIE